VSTPTHHQLSPTPLMLLQHRTWLLWLMICLVRSSPCYLSECSVVAALVCFMLYLCCSLLSTSNGTVHTVLAERHQLYCAPLCDRVLDERHKLKTPHSSAFIRQASSKRDVLTTVYEFEFRFGDHIVSSSSFH
jgi:hypothetical protein